jgi:hypothetical protein
MCKANVRYSPGGETGQWAPSCRAFDPYYNEFYDIDTSAHQWATPVGTDPTSVDSWLSNVGGGIY